MEKKAGVIVRWVMIGRDGGCERGCVGGFVDVGKAAGGQAGEGQSLRKMFNYQLENRRYLSSARQSVLHTQIIKAPKLS